MPITFMTGASSDIGRHLAHRLAARGHPVALAARRIELPESLAEEVQAEGGSAVALACDVTDPAQV